MRIKDIRASAHCMPVTIPLLDGPRENRNFVFCEVETDGGLTGIGYTGAYLPHAVVAALRQHFLPVVRDMDVRDVEAVHHRVRVQLN